MENQSTIKDWSDEKLLNHEQSVKAQTEFRVGFYTSNVFVKIGLFLFTMMVANASIGFVAIFLMPFIEDSKIGIALAIWLYGALLFYALEYFIKKSVFYRSGVDNSLLYMTIGCIIA